jgi:hypothetical protein
MENFNISRFGKMLRWTFWHDKNEFVRSQLQGLLGLTLCFLFMHIGASMGAREGMKAMSLAVVICLVVAYVCTASNMHYSMKSRDDWRALNLLPASNIEKFLARYLSSILQGVGVVVMIFLADIMLYLISLIFIPSSAQLIICHLINGSGYLERQPLQEVLGSMVSLTMLHSCYLAGANLFRNVKYSWVFTTLALIVVAAIIISVLLHTHSSQGQLVVPDWIEYTICCVIIVFNYWLSFRLFCRRQLIGKFINH